MIRTITDISNPELDIFARLNEVQLKTYYEPNGGIFIAESPNVIERALDSGCDPISFLVEDKHIENQAAKLIQRFPEVTVYTAPFEVLTKITGFKLTRGMLAAFKRPVPRSVEEVCLGIKENYPGIKENYPDIKEVSPGIKEIYSGIEEVRLEKEKIYPAMGEAKAKDPNWNQFQNKDKKRRIVVLEDVVNPTNVGAIFRSAAALGIDGVLLTEACSDPYYRRASRVSMGTVFQIPWTYILGNTKVNSQNSQAVMNSNSKNSVSYIDMLHDMGFKTVAMALKSDSISITESWLKEEEKLAIIMGTEGQGLKEDTIAACDSTVMIPMFHGVDSLNVAAASAIAFWELGKK